MSLRELNRAALMLARTRGHARPAERALYAAAGAFAISRPFLGAHYPSDVIAGAALGSAIAEAWPR